ncbi:ribonuclease H [Trifolium pratense]|uniref:Ribonuclease H n=1 Tax=Trifolium pratense TaxID=57577 RepID=A0A2K3K8X0_TRIPR|nr:ribonuclease H [Trifolium pratense]
MMQEKGERGGGGAQGDWKSLWKIRAPPKAKHLLWRICRECLPTKVRLRRHYVQFPTICQLCEEETAAGVLGTMQVCLYVQEQLGTLAVTPSRKLKRWLYWKQCMLSAFTFADGIHNI